MSTIFPETAARVAEWSADPAVLGVLLVGSRSRGHADALSDDDLEVLLTDAAAARRAPAECAELRITGEGAERHVIYDAQYLRRSALGERVASPHDLDHWPYERARVLFDRDGQTVAMVAALAAMDPAFRMARLRHATIDAGIAARRAEKTLGRGFAGAGRVLIARGAKALARIRFALEGRWVPLDHWLEPELHTLADPTGAGLLLVAALVEARPEPLLAALAGLEDRLAAEGVPRGPARRDLFFDSIHPDRAAERAIHGLY